MYGGSHRYTYAPTRENLSLKTDDIPGAKPHPKFSKNADHYHQRLYHQGYPYDNVPQGRNEYPTTMVNDLRMSQPLQPLPYGANSQRTRSMSRERASPMQRLGGSLLAAADEQQYGQRGPERIGGKKHFPQKIVEMSEIRKENIFVHKDSINPQLASFDYPRNLTTHDIPGANPGSLISKVVKNHDIAQKIRLSNNVQADALDHFKNQYMAKPRDPLDDPFWKDYEQHQQKQIESFKQAKDKQKEIQGEQQPRFPLRSSTLQESSLATKNKENAFEALNNNYDDGYNGDDEKVHQNQPFSHDYENQFANEVPFRKKQENLQGLKDQNYFQKEQLDKDYEDLYKAYASRVNDSRNLNIEGPDGDNLKPIDQVAEKPSTTNNDDNQQQQQLSQNLQKFYRDQMTERPPIQEKGQSQNASFDLVQRERLLNQQYHDMKKIYSYNIIANQPQLKYAPAGSRLSNSIKNSYSFETGNLDPKKLGSTTPQDHQYNNNNSGSGTENGSSQPNYNLNSNLLGANLDKGYSRKTNLDNVGSILANRNSDYSKPSYEVDKYIAARGKGY